MLTFIEYMLERQQATDRRRAGQPHPWSSDPAIATRFFCSVVRDQDRTSLEAKAYIATLADRAIDAALIFRLVNRVSTLKWVIESGDRTREPLWMTLSSIDGPIFKTVYRIMVPGGWWNLHGVSLYMELLMAAGAYGVRRETAQETVEAIHHVGPGYFLSYQIMQDLRWVLGPYSDEMTWAYAGPGAVRGLQRLAGTYTPMSSWDRRITGKQMKDTRMPDWIRQPMEGLLLKARDAVGQHINMFEVEHNLCEYDKYCRVTTGETSGARFKPKGELP